MAGAHVGHDLVDQVARGGARGVLVPEMVMRVADRQIGFERGLRRSARASRGSSSVPSWRVLSSASRHSCGPGATRAHDASRARPTANARDAEPPEPLRTYNPHERRTRGARRPTMAVQTSREPIRPVTGTHVVRVQHEGIATADAERSKDFYCRVFGFQVLPRPAFTSGGYWLGTPGIFPQIHIIQSQMQPPGAARADQPARPPHVLRGGRLRRDEGHARARGHQVRREHAARRARADAVQRPGRQHPGVPARDRLIAGLLVAASGVSDRRARRRAWPQRPDASTRPATSLTLTQAPRL